MSKSSNSLIGRKFVQLTITEDAGSDTRGNPMVRCRCLCTAEVVTLTLNVVTGKVFACPQCVREAARYGVAGIRRLRARTHFEPYTREEPVPEVVPYNFFTPVSKLTL